MAFNIFFYDKYGNLAKIVYVFEQTMKKFTLYCQNTS
jgi:hypothetical protein